MKRTRIFAASLLALALVAAACGDSTEETTTTAAPATTAAPQTTTTEAMVEPGTIVEVASEAGSFETLLAAAQAAGLVDTLNSEGPFTVFAPTDEAFAALPEGTVESLLADPEALAEILLYHVVPGNVLAADVVGLTSATSAQGDDIAISVDGGVVILNGSANVVTTDIPASNGTIHVIDAVILPMTEAMADPGTIVEVASEAGTFETLLAAAQAAGLVDTLNGEGPFTVFAPTDEAFAALPEGTVESLLEDPEALAEILLYHVVPGNVLAADVVGLSSAISAQGGEILISVDGGVVILNGSANVVTTDIAASNGIIHVIDAVILPS